MNRTEPLLVWINRAARHCELVSVSDAELVSRFVEEEDEQAFEEMVRRHSGMVTGTCRRMLHHESDLEDAVQTTFIVLLRRAGSINPRNRVGGWLYGVARRTSLKANELRQKRLQKERESALSRLAATQEEEPDWIREWLDEGLTHLPEKYRVPIILCDLEGLTIEQTARQIGCPAGTVASRLSRGRELLARRLGQRGNPVTVPALLVCLTQQRSCSLPPRSLKLSASNELTVQVLQSMTQTGGRMIMVTLMFLIGGAATLGLTSHSTTDQKNPNSVGSSGSALVQKAEKPTKESKVDAVIRQLQFPNIMDVPNADPGETEVQRRLSAIGGWAPRPEHLQPLLAAMKDPKSDLTAKLCFASFLARLGNRKGQQFLENCAQGKQVEKQLPQNGKAEPEVRVALSTPAQVRLNAVYAIRNSSFDRGRAWAVQQMIQILKARLVPVYTMAFRDTCARLGELQVKAAEPILIEIVKENPTMIESCVALGKLGTDRGEKVLLNQLERKGAIVDSPFLGLYTMRSKKLIPVMLRHLDHRLSLLTLAEWRAREAIKPLEARIRQGKDKTGLARIVLAQIAATDDNDYVSRLVKIVEAPENLSDRPGAMELLGETKDKRGVIPIVKRALTTTDSSEWDASLHALKTIGGKPAIEGLQSLLNRDFSTLTLGGKGPRRNPKEEIQKTIRDLRGN